MLGKIRKAILRRTMERQRQIRAYQKFLELLAESPAEWDIPIYGMIRTSQRECPIIEVYQRLTEERGQTDDRDYLFRAADFMGMSANQTNLIIAAADTRSGSWRQVCVRDALLTAIARAKLAREREQVAQENPECAETVGV